MYYYDINVNEERKTLIENSISMLEKLKVPISNSVYFKFSKKMLSTNGTCGKITDSTKLKYKQADYIITICDFIKTTIDIESIVIHELLHTIPNHSSSHKGEWGKWANYVNDKSKYNIKLANDYLRVYPKEEGIVKIVCPICKEEAACKKEKILIEWGFTHYMCPKCNKCLITPNKLTEDTSQCEKTINDIINFNLTYDEKEVIKCLIFARQSICDNFFKYIADNEPNRFLTTERYSNKKMLYYLVVLTSRKAKEELANSYLKGRTFAYQTLSEEEFCHFIGMYSLTEMYMILDEFYKNKKLLANTIKI